MSSIDILAMAIRNLMKRKLRTMLTVLGVVIGTAAIIVMISLGIGINARFEEQLKMYTNLQTIQIYFNGGGDIGVPGKEEIKLNDKAIAQIAEIDGVNAVSPILELYGPTLKSGKYTCEWVQIRGVSDDFIEQFGYKLSSGTGFNMGAKGYTAIIGAQPLMQFYNLKQRNYYMYPPAEVDPYEDKFTMNVVSSWDTSKIAKKYKDINIEIAGVFEEGDYNTDYYIYLPMEQAKDLKKQYDKYQKDSGGGGGGGMVVYNTSSSSSSGSGSKDEETYNQALVRVKDLNDVASVIEKLKEMGFDAWGEGEYVSGMQQTKQNMQMLLGSIGAVALLVAAIGIANTMMMAIYERTKEIGIMKVIGAAIADIKRLFLTEAAFIGLFGGIFGIGISFAVSAIINKFGISFSEQDMYTEITGDTSIIPFWLCLCALAFSTLIGILSGYLPARRAMKVSALTAIRTE